MRVLLRGLLALAVVTSLAASGLALRQRDEATTERDAAEAAAAVELRALRQGADHLARIEAWIADNRGIRDRDQGQADHSAKGISDLGILSERLEQAEADLAALTTLNDEQRRQIGILRECVRTLDAATTTLAHGDPTEAGGILDRGRQACRQAEELADGITAAVHPYDFPDPDVLTVGSTYYAFATNGPAGTIQVLSSTDLADWRIAGSALTGVPSWAVPGFTWAPGVIRTLTGYVLYYTVRHRASGRQCISVATAAEPQGPYADHSSGPLICQLGLGGSIDPDPYQDEAGALFLTWKSEGETAGAGSQLWAQPLDPTGTRTTWFAVPLLETGRSWEGRVIEAPTMARLGGEWVLVYAGNAWNTDRYAIGHARCDGPLGPCARPSGDNVLLRSSSLLAGPGGGDVFRTADGKARLAYAGWDPGAIGPPNPRRMHLASITAGPDSLTLS